MAEEITQQLKDKFADLDYKMQPEVLSCDGEEPMYIQRREYARLMKQWRALEKQAGRQVEPDSEEVWKWSNEKWEREQ